MAGLTDSKLVGELVDFVVESTPVEVALPEWTLFPVSLQVQDAYTGETLEGVTVAFQRAGVAAQASPISNHSQVSDSTGMVRFEDLVPSEWNLSADHEGYVHEQLTVQLPGDWSSGLEKSGVVNLEWLSIAPITSVQFALVGGEPTEDLSAYSISHTHEGAQVPFSSEGLATLVLEWFDEPLYVKVWYPDGRAAVMYLENGLPDEGEVHEIEIGGKRQLEIDLRFSDTVKKELQEVENGGLRVSFRPKSGEAKFVGVETKTEGTFTFDDVQAEAAVVNFATASGGTLPVDWKTVWVDLQPVGTTTCTLLVDQQPLNLLFQDGDEGHVASYAFELRQLPNTTSWLAGGVSSETGVAQCVRVSGNRCALFGTVQGTTNMMAIDLPLQMAGASKTLTVDLGDREPTFLAVQLAGNPVEGVPFVLEGRDTGVSILEVSSNESGETDHLDLVRNSRANAILNSGKHWMPVSSIELQPGRNVVHVHELGQITLRDPQQLHRVVHTQLRTSPASWLKDGLIAPPDAATKALTVPAGSYLVDEGLQTERMFTVSAGTSVDSGL